MKFCKASQYVVGCTAPCLKHINRLSSSTPDKSMFVRMAEILGDTAVQAAHAGGIVHSPDP